MAIFPVFYGDHKEPDLALRMRISLRTPRDLVFHRGWILFELRVFVVSIDSMPAWFINNLCMVPLLHNDGDG